ncbi:M48 family metalloprotease [Vibrio breoganii]
MDLFQRQDTLRSQFARLCFVYLICIGVLSFIVSGLTVASIFYFDIAGVDDGFTKVLLGNIKLVSTVASAVIAVVTFVALIKFWRLNSAGIEGLVRSLGATEINPEAATPKYNVLVNVVEEMQLASGGQMPRIFVMRCDSINAFAATVKGEALIGVTEGALKHFSRRQLQAVVAHEYGHIVNGDSRINLMLTAAMYSFAWVLYLGIHCISGNNRSTRVGFALIVLGGLGVCFSTVIGMMMYRQREYLADASAVQFVRDPEALASALELIRDKGGDLESIEASESSHLFFSDPGISYASSSSKWAEIFSTHPPIDKRIRALRST